jgi:Flp pilus assembly pilin Flp
MQIPIQSSGRLSSFRQLRGNNRGVSTVEYVIILVLIAAVSITAWKGFGATIMGKVTDSDEKVKKDVVF